MIYSLFILQTQLSNDASETLKDLSPWAYVIVTLTLVIAGTFLKLYISEKKQNDELEKEFRSFMSESLTQQIDVSKDVIDLVSGNKAEIKDALSMFNRSDIKIGSLISELQKQLNRIESAINKYSQ